MDFKGIYLLSESYIHDTKRNICLGI